MRRILIRVDGSYEIGMGHISRSISLACKMRSMGHRVVFLSREDDVANSMVAKFRFPLRLIKRSIDPDIFQLEILRSETPDVIVIDMLGVRSSYIRFLKRNSNAKIVSIDDVKHGLNQSDLVINPITFCWNAYKRNNVKARLLEGLKYLILNPAIPKKSMRRTSAKLSANTRKIFVAFGGTDNRGLSLRCMKALNYSKTRYSIHLNLGTAAKISSELSDAVAGSIHKVHVTQGVPNLHRCAMNCDFVICAGGIMLAEFAALGIPTVSIAAERHEIAFANHISLLGASLFAGWERKIDSQELCAFIDGLSTDRLKRMTRAGTKSVDFDGVTRVAEAILNVCSRR